MFKMKEWYDRFMHVCNLYIQSVLIILILILSFKNLEYEGDTM